MMPRINRHRQENVLKSKIQNYFATNLPLETTTDLRFIINIDF